MEIRFWKIKEKTFTTNFKMYFCAVFLLFLGVFFVVVDHKVSILYQFNIEWALKLLVV